MEEDKLRHGVGPRQKKPGWLEPVTGEERSQGEQGEDSGAGEYRRKQK